MKKMFLFLAAASLVSATAFAQDDYDYGDDYGSSESASASDDGFTDMGSGDESASDNSGSDVDYKSMDDESKKTSRNEGEGGSLFDKPYNLGWNAGLGFGGFFSTEVCNPTLAAQRGYSVCDDYGGDLFGGSFEFGGSINYHFTNFLSLIAEANIDLRFYMTDLGQFYIRGTDDYGYTTSYYSNVSLDALVIGLQVPVLARYNFTPTIYAEAGLNLELNLGTSISFSDEDGTEVTGMTEEMMGDKWIYNYFDVNGFVAGIVLGGGTTLDVGKFFTDVGVRIIIDLMPYVKLDDMFTNVGWEQSSAKSWQIQFYMNPWFK